MKPKHSVSLAKLQLALDDATDKQAKATAARDKARVAYEDAIRSYDDATRAFEDANRVVDEARASVLAGARTATRKG